MSFWKKLQELLEAISQLFGSNDSNDSDNGNDEQQEPEKNDFDEIIILGNEDVKNWKVTADMNVSFTNSFITLDYDKANVWKLQREAGADVNANPWVIFDYKGKTYAATWEWLRFGQTRKSKKAVAGDHIKRNEIPNNWKPKKGQRLGFCVSGLIRGRTRNVSERTPIVYVNWP